MSGTIEFSTIGDPNGGETPIDGYNPANSFTNITSGAIITNVDLVLNETVQNDPGYLSISLYSDSGTGSPPTGPIPNQFLSNLGTVQNSSIVESQIGGASYSVIVTSNYTLEANAKYWIVLTETSGAQAQIAFTGNDTTYPDEYNAYLFQSGGNSSYLVSGDTTPSGPSLISVSAETACFCEGTAILTDHGYLAVECLYQGCMIALLEGGYAPVKWLGYRTVIDAKQTGADEMGPVRIRRGAFGLDIPHRDLKLSPDHSIYFKHAGAGQRGALIPVRHLLNGATLVQERRKEVTYYHVELDQHNIIIAEGLAVESYLDTGNRAAFENGYESGIQENNSLQVWEQRGCAPLLLHGPLLLAFRAELSTRALELGFACTADPDVHLIVDGYRIDGFVSGCIVEFQIPQRGRTIQIASRSSVPCQVLTDSLDMRRLGIGLSSLIADGCELLPAFGNGWHHQEPDGQWTDGLATVDRAGVRTLVLRIAMKTRYWTRDLLAPTVCQPMESSLHPQAEVGYCR